MTIVQTKYNNEVILEANQTLHELHCLFVKQEFEFVKAKLLEEIKIYRDKFLALNQVGNEEAKNSILLMGILHKAFYELVEVIMFMKDEKWLLDKIIVKLTWHKLWNCKERIDFVSYYIDGEFINWVCTIIKIIDEEFLEYFGHGKYSSPTIVCKSIICNICRDDFRKCSHRAGKIYNGSICSPVKDISKVEDVSIVHNPQDPRCRIWPWELDENRGQNGDIDIQIRTTVMVAFRLDDFLTD